MINYSITMRSVNSNLLAINQAKSRINQAKKEGKNPDEADLNLVKTEKKNAFAVSQYSDIMDIEKFSKHISSHGSVYSRADISAILYMTVDCMREQLLEGKKIRLGDLGDFSILLSSRGAEDADKFTAQMAVALTQAVALLQEVTPSRAAAPAKAPVPPQAATTRATLDRTATETTN